MISRTLIALTIVLQFEINMVGAIDAPLDGASVEAKAKSLEAQSREAKNLGDKMTSAEALYRLTVRASEIPELSSAARLTLVSAACEAYNRYLISIPWLPQDLAAFAAAPGASNSVLLLEAALKMIPPKGPPVIQNVGPLSNPAKPGQITVSAGGMDPKGIQDPKARAEYEQRIAENNRRNDENNARARIEQATFYLKSAIGRVLIGLSREGKADSLKAALVASGLAPEVKAEILAEHPRFK